MIPVAAVVVALAAALLGGAHWAGALAAGALWIAALFAKGLSRLLALLAAPIALAGAMDVDALVSVPALLAAVAALASLAPFVVALGPPSPSPVALLLVLGACAIGIAVAFTPPGAAIAASDLQTGFAIVALFAGTVLVATAARRARG